MPARSEINVCVPVAVDGLLDPRWGRADRVAVATVSQKGIDDWKEFDVGWGNLHDAGTEGSHHARVARFLLDHGVEAVVAHHMGAGMTHMLEQMGSRCGSVRQAAQERPRPEFSGAERDTERHRPSSPSLLVALDYLDIRALGAYEAEPPPSK